MKLPYIFCAVGLSIICVFTVVIACGPFLPVNYLGNGNEKHVLDMPHAKFIVELKRILIDEEILQKSPEGETTKRKYTGPKGFYSNTLKQDIRDLSEALDELCADRSEKRAAEDLYLKARNRWAGTWLKVRDDEAADKYYQALLTHCPNHQLTVEAKKIHWFPEITHEDDPVQ